MFEKEAEEWWNNEYSPSLYDNVSEVWQDGAEFGYNKANKRLIKAKEIIKGLLSCCRNYPQENAGKIEQAEQFIREVEK